MWEFGKMFFCFLIDEGLKGAREVMGFIQDHRTRLTLFCDRTKCKPACLMHSKAGLLPRGEGKQCLMPGEKRMGRQVRLEALAAFRQGLRAAFR